MEPRTLGRYEIVCELGRGTMGVVYRAHDPVIDREVALKSIIIPDAVPEDQRTAYLERFFNEARIAGKLVHPNIVITYDAAIDEQSDLPFIAMELVHGEPLSVRVEREGRLAWREAVDIVVPLAHALAYAAECGIVHRDVKPANVLLTEGATPKLSDFGIAKLSTSQLTKAGVIRGTPYFISPEALRGETLDGRSDLFSLGSSLYNLLVGTPPFPGPEIPAIFHQVLSEEPRWPSQMVKEIPPALDTVLRRMLAKAPGDRYASGNELASDLRAVRSGEDTTVSLGLPVGTEEAPQRAVPASPSTRSEARDDTAEPAARKPRRVLRWSFVVAVAAAAVYVVTAGPDRVVEHTRAVAQRLNPVRSWVADRKQSLESSVREARIERERLAALGERASALVAEGDHARELGQWAQARAAYDDSLEVWREAEAGAGEGLALVARGNLMAGMGEWEKARADLDAAVAVCRLYDETSTEAAALVGLGVVERDLGRFDTAKTHFDRAFATVEDIEDPGPWASALVEQSLLSLLLGRWDHARSGLETVLSQGAAVDEVVRMRALVWLGVVAFVTEDDVQVDSRWSEAEELCSAGADRTDCVEILLWRGRVRLATGDLASARALFATAKEQYRRSQHLPGLAAALENLAEITDREGEADRAGAWFDQAAEIRSQLGLGQPTALDATEDAPELDEDGTRRQRLVFLLGAAPRTALSESRRETARRAGTAVESVSTSS